MRENIASWVLVLSVAGYPIVGIVASLAGLDSLLTSIPFRLAIALLGLLLVALSVTQPIPFMRLSWLLLFWMIYLFRLAWDISHDVRGADDALIYFAGTALAPAAVLCIAPSLDWQKAAKRIVLLGALSAGLSLLTIWYGWDVGLVEGEHAGRLSAARVNPIVLAHAAVTTLLAIMCLRTTWLRWTFHMLVAAMAVACLVLSGARGAVVAFAVCLFVLAIYTKRWSWMFLVAVLIAGLVVYVEEFLLLERLLALASGRLEDTASLERLAIMENALRQFQEQPIFGSSYIEPEYQIYPHNLFVESLMATGVVGTFVLLALLWKAFRKSLLMMRAGEYLFPILLLQYLVAMQFSWAIWSAPQLWVLLPLVLVRKPQ